MQKIVFEDTTVVKAPYVEINGVEYEVQGGTYQGGTDLDADTFNTMQDNIEEAISGIQPIVHNSYSTSETEPYSASYTNASIPTIRNDYNSSTIDAYSSNFVNNLHTYSTNEIRVGEWLGKPLYRKVIDIGNLPNATYKEVAHGISNLDIATNIRLIAKSSTGAQFTNNMVGTGSVYDGRTIVTRVNSTNIQIASNIDSSNHSGYVIIEYTKTTD